MNNSLDISIHGSQRVAIVEQLVHLCRYTPGLVLLEGEAGKSPVNFLRHMADLLKDELDFALIENHHNNIARVAVELLAQWYIYQGEGEEQTDVQSIHHYLDIGLQSGRLALIVIERASSLTDDAMNFLISMMARHSRLTVLFAGIVDARPLLRRAQQAEVPVHRIDLPDHESSPVASLSSSHFDHTFSDSFDKLPEEDDLDTGYTPDFMAAEPRGRLEPVMGRLSSTAKSSRHFDFSESMLGASVRFSATQAWAAATLASMRKRKSRGALLLMIGFLVLIVLILLMALDFRDAKTPAVLPMSTTPIAPPTSAPPPVIGSASTIVAIAPAAPPSLATSEAAVVTQPVVQENKEAVSHAPETPEPLAASVPVVAPVVAGGSSEKLWRSKPGNYTVQIAAAQSEANIRALEAKLPASQPHFVYKAVRNGKPWFVLLYGSFASKQAAASARDALAPDFKKDSTPWVRKQGEVFAQ